MKADYATATTAIKCQNMLNIQLLLVFSA